MSPCKYTSQITRSSRWLSNGQCGQLTHWGRVTHICARKLTIIGSDNGLSPGRRQAIIWTNAGILLSGPLGTNFSEILIEIQTFSLKKIHLKMLCAKCCSFRLGLNVLSHRTAWIMAWYKLATWNRLRPLCSLKNNCRAEDWNPKKWGWSSKSPI